MRACIPGYVLHVSQLHVRACVGGWVCVCRDLQAGYVTTYEEYQHQRYEGGSTAYGPHTHGAMTNILREMAVEMAEGKVYRWPGAVPRIPTEDQMMEGQSGVVADDPPTGGQFGDVERDVYPTLGPRKGGVTSQEVPPRWRGSGAT